MDEPKEFEIRQPRWLFVFGIISTVLFSLGIILTVVLTLLFQSYAIMSILPLLACFLFLGLGIVSIHSYRTDMFAFRNGCFISKNTFKKVKQVPVSSIHFAKLFFYRGACTIHFLDKNNEVLLVTDGTEAIKKDVFKYVIYYYDIEVVDGKYNPIDLMS